MWFLKVNLQMYSPAKISSLFQMIGVSFLNMIYPGITAVASGV